MKTADKENSAVSMAREALARAEKYADHNIFIEICADEALARAEEIDRRIAAGEEVGRLAGVPYALKDNFLSPVGHTTAAAKILEPFKAPVTATAVEKIEAEGAIMIGRVNLDAFAHGSSTENSYFGPTLNAVDTERVAGGSSGGSAVAVALDIVQFAFGTDTGGSIRQPASFNGVYGLKPTYGTISRYGVVAMASSTDVVGFFTKEPEDMDLLMSIAAGRDAKDMTSLPDFYDDDVREIKRVGVVREFDNDLVDESIRAALREQVEKLEAAGYEIVELSMPALKYALAVYYIVVPAEISSNLSRYDGVRYGFRDTSGGDLASLYAGSRNIGFMPENKRRILIGNFVLSSGFYDAYYLKAQKARTLIIEEYQRAFEKCDAILTPVSPSPAFKLGAKMSDPVTMYMEDVMSVPVNLAGVPSLAIPCGEAETGEYAGLPVGLQVIGPRRSDAALVAFAGKIKEMEEKK